jgi:hypothetical protein
MAEKKKKVTKQEQLVNAGILKAKMKLSPEESAAVESLSPGEVKALISTRQKLHDAFANRKTIVLGHF